MKSKISLAFLSAALLVACGDETTIENINQMGMDVVASEDDLPECAKDNEGEQAFVKDAGTTLVCVDGDWISTNPNEAGAFSCKTVELKDKSGLKIVCNGDSIGVVLNGEKGDTGEGCSISNQTDSTVTIACGGKKLTMNIDGGFSIVEAEADSEKVAISLDSLAGYTQKGPFLKGSTVYLYELSDGRTLKQTNGNFASKITRDDGRYKFTARDLVSQYAMLVVDGFYRNEVTGVKSDASLRLTALTDMRKRNSANVNLRTHLEFDRVYHLVTRGDSTGKKLTVKQAKRQAQKEILKQFHIELDSSTDAEDMDVFGKTDADAALLAVSVLLQGDSGATDLSVLLADISNDIAEYGKWKNDSVKAAIADWAMVADNDDRLITFGNNVANWGLGEAPDFAKYVRNYWKKEYGIDGCTSANEGKYIATKDGENWYHCFANDWKKIVGWGWDYPKDFYYNHKIVYGTLIDSRDYKTYRIVTIGDQTWMAENLNYYDEKNLSVKDNSWCFGKLDNKDSSTCDVAGRLYTWAAAIDSVKFATDLVNPQECGYGKTCTLPAKVRGICPVGWHLPSESEWHDLFFNNGIGTTAKALRFSFGWGGDGTDVFGFSALPTGFRGVNGNYRDEGSYAGFWGSTESSTDQVYHLSVPGMAEIKAGSKAVALSVRCVQD